MMDHLKKVRYNELRAIQRACKGQFLLWNNIGAMTCYNEHIQISFHHVLYHRLITIDNKTDKCSIEDLLSVIVPD
ncbi:unnamed protein product [Rotaria sp. Silwood1]|nr:unnamed protein product [Rotaria sp. Silwood1]CAF5034348.1 unnamed protein product [Rotaria sp. Silwood1]